MENSKTSFHTLLAGLLAGVLLCCATGAHATAPRIAPQLFGEERKSDVVAYQLFSMASAKAGDEMIAELVRSAFSAGGENPVVDMLPSRQLARYALFNGDAAALVGLLSDVHEKERKQYRVVTFYLVGSDDRQEPVVLACRKQNSRADNLCKAFEQGLRQLIKKGQYRQIVDKQMGTGKVPADILEWLKPHNPGWK
ncbi:MAG: hypothetical protein PHH47_09415 [Gallionella sp.]|nr:hypothetical protein [Gallionella sp.]MDD4947774.1 hypothetical protein [Gallionella sp.]MDD5613058.1 hypothetical protein [Gallionella sp.]